MPEYIADIPYYYYYYYYYTNNNNYYYTPPRYNWNIVDSGVKHHKHKHIIIIIVYLIKPYSFFIIK